MLNGEIKEQILIIDDQRFKINTKFPMRQGDRIYISNVILVAYYVTFDLKTKTSTVFLEAESEPVET